MRVIAGRSATLTHTFYENGVPTNPTPDAATVTITRANGTALVTDAAATDAGVGVVTFTLTPAQTATLDVLTVTWKATIGGQLQSFVDVLEVVGDVFFTLADARMLPGPNGGVLKDPIKYPDAAILAARDMASDAIEHAANVRFTPHYFTETLDGARGQYVRLRTARPRSLMAVTINATTVTDAQLLADGRVYRELGWAADPRGIVIAGTAGYDRVPARVAHAALLLAKRWLVDTNISDRATTTTNSDGSAQYFVTAGVKGALFDVPEANAVIEDYGIRKGRMVA